MRFKSPLDELQHWLGLLTIDIGLGVARRHIEATSRLCWLLVDQLEKNPGDMNQETFTLLSLQLLDLQRRIDPPRREPKGIVKAGPRLRLVGQ